MTTKQDRVSDETLEEMASFYRALRKSRSSGNDELASALTELQSLRAVLPRVREALEGAETTSVLAFAKKSVSRAIHILDSLEVK